MFFNQTSVGLINLKSDPIMMTQSFFKQLIIKKISFKVDIYEK